MTSITIFPELQDDDNRPVQKHRVFALGLVRFKFNKRNHKQVNTRENLRVLGLMVVEEESPSSSNNGVSE